MEPLSRTWLILAPFPRSWLAFARSCMAMVSLPRSWQVFGKTSKELAMNLGKATKKTFKPKNIKFGEGEAWGVCSQAFKAAQKPCSRAW